MFKISFRKWTGVLFISIIPLVGCAQPPEIVIEPTALVEPTESVATIEPTEIPLPRTLVVCLGRSPESLYLYGEASPEADAVLQAIYDGPVDLVDHSYQPVILGKLPSFEDDHASIEVTTVAEGERYLNPLTQSPDFLSDGLPYLPSGCRDSNCMQEYSEGEVEMDRIAVQFELLPDITWSDGSELTADDSVFSFELDANEATPSTKYLVQRTESYEALDELTTQWVGIPGFLDPEFQSNFWSPLPRHALENFDPSELPSLDEAAKYPLGWGPYIIDSWVENREILLRKSPSYFRSSEGLPAFDLLRIRFLGSDFVSALEQVLTGECDVLDESVFPPMVWGSALDYESAGRLHVASSPGNVMERIDFNTRPFGELSPPSLFSNLTLRQVFAACVDRERILETALHGLSGIPQSYLPLSHPNRTAEGEIMGMSLSEAINRLESMGWVDDDGDPSTPRIAQGVVGVTNGTALQIRYLALDGFLQESVVEILEDSLARCGIGLRPEFGEAQEIFEPWPNGPVFGGRFEAVEWGWPIFVAPPCEMFAGFEIPSVDYLYGINATGFEEEEYDSACRRVLNGPADGDDFRDAIATTEEIFRSQLPSIPLFMRPRLMAYGNTTCGPAPKTTVFSVLWNIEEYLSGEDCLEN